MKKCFLFVLLIMGLLLCFSSYAQQRKGSLNKLKREVITLKAVVIKQHTAQQMFSRCITPLSMTILLLEKAESDLQAAIDGSGLEDVLQMRRVNYDLSASVRELSIAESAYNCQSADGIKQASHTISLIYNELVAWLGKEYGRI